MAHHDSLLKLTEPGKDSKRKLWLDLNSKKLENWTVLTGDSDGTEEQRMFVTACSLTPDFAILQGPPDSGKTTAIIELMPNVHYKISEFFLWINQKLHRQSLTASFQNQILLD